MYSREEAKLLKQEFWTTFGQWSQKKRKSRGKGKWLLNRTGAKGYRFKFEAEKKTLCVCLEIIDDDEIIREIRYEKLLMLKPVFDEATNHELIWDPNFFIAPGKAVSRIYFQKKGFTLNNRQHWTEIFSFFYHKMSNLEDIFEEYKELLDE